MGKLVASNILNNNNEKNALLSDSAFFVIRNIFIIFFL